MCSSGSLLPEFLGEPDENSFKAPDVAEPILVFVLDHFANELRAAFAEPTSEQSTAERFSSTCYWSAGAPYSEALRAPIRPGALAPATPPMK